MKYKCQDIGMIRCASLNKRILKVLMNDEFDIYKTVDLALNGKLGIEFDDLKIAIRIASESLFESLNNYKEIKCDKKRKQINIALYKYIVRMASRAVPFGIFSSVGLFEFDENNSIKFDSDEFYYSIKLDKEWINKLLHRLETDKCNSDNLMLFLNNNIYCIGNTYKNPYHSAFGLQKDLNGPEIIEFTAKRAFLLAIPFLKKGIGYKKLLSMYKENYPNVKEEIVYSMLRNLIEMEFIYTNFRPLADMKDTDILNLLSRCESNNNKLMIEDIITNIEFATKNATLIPKDLNNVIDMMKELCFAQNYVKVDKGLKLLDNKVNKKLKVRVENFVNTISKIPLKIMDDGINNIINCFLDRVGYDVLVPLTMAIDSTRFDILKLDSEKLLNQPDAIDNKFRSMVDEKIQVALMKNKDYIDISENEIDKLISNAGSQIYEANWVNSMDLAFTVTGEEGKEELFLSPNIGSSKMGNYFQRFSDVFDSYRFDKFLDCYEENTNNTEIKTIEAFEMEKIGHINNICKNHKRYENSISLGYRNNNKYSEIYLSDLYLFVSSKNSKLYIYSKKLNSLCRVVADDMLNYESNGRVLKLLKKISYSYEEYKVVERLASLYTNSYIYVPRIIIAGVCVSGKKWKINSEFIRNESKENFERDFKEYAHKFNLPNIVYIEQYDNRLLINLKNESCMLILYNLFKTNGYVLISEVENKIMEDSFVGDIRGNSYNSELVFSLSKKMNKVENSIDIKEKVSYLQEKNLLFHPFEKGWIYIKIYGISQHNENKILEDIFEFNQLYGLNNCFFIRYIDKLGKHLRIRYKFSSKKKAMYFYNHIGLMLSNLYEEGIIGNWSMDDYIRETNRYGGIDKISSVEELFMCESRMIVSILGIEEDEFLKYCLGIVTILKALFLDDYKKMYDFLSPRFKPRDMDKHAHNQARKYLREVMKLFSSNKILADSQDEYYTKLKKIFCDIDIEDANNGDIVFSIIHMYANRLFGDVEKEYTMNSLFIRILKSIKAIANN